VSPQVWVALIVGTAAVVEDLARRRISNWIPCVAFVGGLGAQFLAHGWRGVGSGLLGSVAGFFVFLVFYLLGGMGGGDVKLMAGFGAVLGVKKLLEAALWTGACGGLMAAGVIAFASIRAFWSTSRPVSGMRQSKTIPYAPAIAAGVWLSLVPKM
jgi:prepilin peptidase CpaA